METLGRSANLFWAPAPIEVDGRFRAKRLIHKDTKRINVRAKSEVTNAGLHYYKGIAQDSSSVRWL